MLKEVYSMLRCHTVTPHSTPQSRTFFAGRFIMASPSNETDAILEAALHRSFSAPPSRPRPVQPEQPDSAAVSQPESKPEAATQVSTESSISEKSEGSDDWKEQYEAQLQSWRAQSAEARLKAEKERERWEAIRKVEKEEAARRGAEATVEELPSAPQVVQESLSSSIITTVEQPASLTDDSQRWEDVHSSVTSSFPSMSFPDRTDSPSPQLQATRPHSVPQTATMAIFDSSLSTKTRIKALLSSLAINMLLPFVNGVMLGFGEIFAKKLIIEQLGWGSWKSSRPGSVAATTGLRQKQTIFR